MPATCEVPMQLFLINTAIKHQPLRGWRRMLSPATVIVIVIVITVIPQVAAAIAAPTGTPLGGRGDLRPHPHANRNIDDHDLGITTAANLSTGGVITAASTGALRWSIVSNKACRNEIHSWRRSRHA